MTPEDLVAEVRQLAQREGCPVDLSSEDLDTALIAAMTCIEQKTRADLAASPEAQRKDFWARYPQHRDLLRQ
jgi:hypothetical protein